MELGIMIGDKNHWNKGYGSDTIKTKIKHIFKHTDYHKIYLHTLKWNLRAQSSFKKSGFNNLREVSKEGKKFIDIYFSKYPGIQKYLDGVKEQCKQNGYVETILGRRRYLPDINSRNFRFRSQAERAAINMPIQGTAADIIKVAMINIQKRLDKSQMKSMMILQVHDELIFETPKDEVLQLNSIISELMPSALKLDVPITIDTKMGSTWGTLK